MKISWAVCSDKVYLCPLIHLPNLRWMLFLSEGTHCTARYCYGYESIQMQFRHILPSGMIGLNTKVSTGHIDLFFGTTRCVCVYCRFTQRWLLHFSTAVSGPRWEPAPFRVWNKERQSVGTGHLACFQIFFFPFCVTSSVFYTARTRLEWRSLLLTPRFTLDQKWVSDLWGR
jgi:hypothetical protein